MNVHRKKESEAKCFGYFLVAVVSCSGYAAGSS